MNIFGFNLTCGILGHYARIHLECNTLFSWLDYMFYYDESENGFRMVLELCKVQLFIGISSCIQDVYNFTNTSYFIRQDHSNEDLPEYRESEEE